MTAGADGIHRLLRFDVWLFFFAAAFRLGRRATDRARRARDEVVALFRFRFGADFRDVFGLTRSGKCAPPVSRFHSSKTSGVISPSTRSCANFRRWALLLKGISVTSLEDVFASYPAGPIWPRMDAKAQLMAIPLNALHPSSYPAAVTMRERLNLLASLALARSNRTSPFPDTEALCRDAVDFSRCA